MPCCSFMTHIRLEEIYSQSVQRCNKEYRLSNTSVCVSLFSGRSRLSPQARRGSPRPMLGDCDRTGARPGPPRLRSRTGAPPGPARLRDRTGAPPGPPRLRGHTAAQLGSARLRGRTVTEQRQTKEAAQCRACARTAVVPVPEVPAAKRI